MRPAAAGWVVLLLVGCESAPTAESGDTGFTVECPDAAWVQLEAGALLSCGIREGGCAECWGNTALAYELAETPEATTWDTGWRYTDYHDDRPPNLLLGQIVLPRATPGSAMRPDGRLHPTQGSFFGCGLTLGGYPVCWGDDRLEQASPPEATLTALSLGRYDGCGVKENSSLCWGYGAGFHPGLRQTVQAVDMASDDWMCGLSNGTVGCAWAGIHETEWLYGVAYSTVSSVDTRYEKGFCALDLDDQLTCQWDGEVDMETYYGIPAEQTALELCVGIDAQLICVLDLSGLPRCWHDSVLLAPDVAAAREQGPLHGLTCGLGHACALTEAGEAVCWGDNQAGQAEPPGSWTRLSGEQAIVEWYPGTRP